jgi:hypothetical protein
MTDIIESGTWPQMVRRDGDKTYVMGGENVGEAKRQAALASVYSSIAESAALAAQAYTNFRSTLADGVADFAVGEYFSSAESGAMRLYERIGTAPYYLDMGDDVAPVSGADLAATGGAALIGAAAGGTLQDVADEVGGISAVGWTLLGQATKATMRTTGLGLSADASTFVTEANYAAMRTALDVLSSAAIAAAYQPLFGTIAVGAWTPTLTGETNVAASTPQAGEYMRLGDRVHCMCHMQIDPTAAGLVELGVSLPVASDFDATYRGGGSLSSALGTLSGLVTADVTNNRLKIRANATVTTAVDVVLEAFYRIQ